MTIGDTKCPICNRWSVNCRCMEDHVNKELMKYDLPRIKDEVIGALGTKQDDGSIKITRPITMENVETGEETHYDGVYVKMGDPEIDKDDPGKINISMHMQPFVERIEATFTIDGEKVDE